MHPKAIVLIAIIVLTKLACVPGESNEEPANAQAKKILKALGIAFFEYSYIDLNEMNFFFI
jgi:hypothetical protein